MLNLEEVYGEVERVCGELRKVCGNPKSLYCKVGRKTQIIKDPSAKPVYRVCGVKTNVCGV